MTDFEQMTDEELRMEIAKARGWHDFHMQHFLDFSYLQGREKWNDIFSHNVPEWPTILSHAWELVDEMLYYDIKSITKGEVVAVLYPERNLMKAKVGKAATAPRAICIAYLMLVASRQ